MQPLSNPTNQFIVKIATTTTNKQTKNEKKNLTFSNVTKQTTL